MSCTCASCKCKEGQFTVKKDKIRCIKRDDATRTLTFDCLDSGEGPFRIKWDDLSTNCPGDGEQVATKWEAWEADVIGTLLLGSDFCFDNGIPFLADDPKHPPGFPMRFSAALQPQAEAYQVTVEGVRLDVRFVRDPSKRQLIDPYNPKVLNSLPDFKLTQGSEGTLDLNPDYVRRMLLPDYPGATVAALSGGGVYLHWVTVLMTTSEGQPVDVALHDESRVTSHKLASLEPGTKGSIRLTQKAWSEWNLPTLRDRAVEFFHRMDQRPAIENVGAPDAGHDALEQLRSILVIDAD